MAFFLLLSTTIDLGLLRQILIVLIASVFLIEKNNNFKYSPFFFRKEIGIIRWRGAILSSFDSLYFTNTPIAGFISITTLLLTNNHLTAFQIFTLMSTLNVIKFSVSVSMGETLHLLADAKVSFDRIQKFLEVNSFPGLGEDDIKLKLNGSPTFDRKHFEAVNVPFDKFTSLFTIPEKEHIKKAYLKRSQTESWISLKKHLLQLESGR